MQTNPVKITQRSEHEFTIESFGRKSTIVGFENLLDELLFYFTGKAPIYPDTVRYGKVVIENNEDLQQVKKLQEAFGLQMTAARSVAVRIRESVLSVDEITAARAIAARNKESIFGTETGRFYSEKDRDNAGND